jgi:hypothetical protein
MTDGGPVAAARTSGSTRGLPNRLVVPFLSVALLGQVIP